jgi:hypothetical protein
MSETDEVETHKTTPNMRKFFDKLLGVKEFVRSLADENPENDDFEEIYKRLHEIIREKGK